MPDMMFPVRQYTTVMNKTKHRYDRIARYYDILEAPMELTGMGFHRICSRMPT